MSIAASPAVSNRPVRARRKGRPSHGRPPFRYSLASLAVSGLVRDNYAEGRATTKSEILARIPMSAAQYHFTQSALVDEGRIVSDGHGRFVPPGCAMPNRAAARLRTPTGRASAVREKADAAVRAMVAASAPGHPVPPLAAISRRYGLWVRAVSESLKAMEAEGLLARDEFNRLCKPGS